MQCEGCEGSTKRGIFEYVRDYRVVKDVPKVTEDTLRNLTRQKRKFANATCLTS